MIDNREGGPLYEVPLRDHLAGEAINGLLCGLVSRANDGKDLGEALPKLCAMAWKVADWMIETGRPQ